MEARGQGVSSDGCAALQQETAAGPPQGVLGTRREPRSAIQGRRLSPRGDKNNR